MVNISEVFGKMQAKIIHALMGLPFGISQNMYT
jgi:hypothetical protein